ncbi:hypothetical protein M422DRAFT_249592 [Sphaerobolus stellatus SS14]|uniref:Protein kinase domain-containing protein n=1 Tax=Sphaerobolus stellatus (strain SS14) TaxID=990650 RepID=A0A0C9W533_SPHS4|nr:hypothetical protein M422DRAFT_249592 [Sphaerobolus stellatus SS14]
MEQEGYIPIILHRGDSDEHVPRRSLDSLNPPEDHTEKEIMNKLRRLVNRSDILSGYSVTRIWNQTDIGNTTIARSLSGSEQVFIVRRSTVSISRAERIRFVNWLVTMKRYRHQNIHRFISAHLPVDDSLYVVHEYMNHGSLDSLVRRREQPIPEDIIARITIEILKALQYLHLHGIIHRNVNPDSILLHVNQNDCSIKLSGLFLVAKLSDRNAVRDNLIFLYPHYVAPEMVAGKPYKYKVDIWALGITILEAMERKPTYHESDTAQVLELIKANGTPTAKEPEKLSRELKRFLSMALCVPVGSRASADELLKNSFLESATSSRSVAKYLMDSSKDGSDTSDELLDERLL